MNSKPLNRETFLSDIAGRNALVICSDIDSVCELIKTFFRKPVVFNAAPSTVTFTTDASEALTLASADHSRIVFTLGATEAVITF